MNSRASLFPIGRATWLRWAVMVPLLWLLYVGASGSAHAAPRELRVGVYSNEPKLFVDAQGHPSGIFVDLLQLVATREHWTLRYVPCEWQGCLDALAAGQLDLMPDVARTSERERLYDFHALPVMHSWSQIYRARSSTIQSMFDLAGKRVAVLKGSVQRSTFLSMMDSFGIAVLLIDAPTLMEAFAFVQRGDADAVIANHFFGNQQADGYGLVDSGIVFQPSALYFATSQGRNADVLAAIDRSVQGWRTGADPHFSQVMSRWAGPEADTQQMSSAMGWAMVALAVAALMAAVSALVLRRTVDERTRKLQASEQKLATILDSVGAFIYIKGQDFRYQYANHHILGLFGRPAQDVVGLDDSAFFDQATTAQLHDNDRRVLQQGERLEIEEINTHLATGETRAYLSVKIPLRHPDGSIHALCGISSDITERRRAEESLRIAATVFESFEGMVVTGPDQRILSANQSYARITGYTVQELVGQTPRLLQSGRHDAQFYATLKTALGESGGWQGEVWNRRKNGEVYPAWITVTAVRSPLGQITHYVGTQTDISARKAAEEEIRLLAYYDPLTGLPNRRLMADRLQHSLAGAARLGTGGALLFVDLDNFKDLNDTQGHEIGDQLLCQVASRLGGVRQGATVARLGGDEFALLIEGLSADPAECAAQAEAVGRTVLLALGQDYPLGGRMYHGSCSIGVALYADAHSSVDELLKRGDLAMYQAKGAGRNTLRFFDPRAQAAVSARTALEADLRVALREGQFLLYYQPQIDQHDGMVGAEALVRWHHPERGLVSPAEFVPVAEASGLIVPLGEWILRTACKQLVQWARSPVTASWSVAVNVSARQFRHPDFVIDVLRVLEDTGADPQQLKLELTETLLLDDVEDTIVRMTTLRALGIRFSLDDFGTGYSSLAYLKRLPLDQLKIDQGFVRDLLTNANDASIARAIVTLAHSLDLGVIAEGVETAEQRDMLASMGCLTWQGYLFGRPGPASALLPAPHGDVVDIASADSSAAVIAII